MKKTSNAIVKDYENYSDSSLEFYGLNLKDGRVLIDTKRYKKFFNLPDQKIERRKEKYYRPSKVKRYDYTCNVMRDTIEDIRKSWFTEYRKAIDVIKTPKEVEDQTRLSAISSGYYDIDEVNEKSVLANALRVKEYKLVIKSIYAQFFHQMMAQVEALACRECKKHGYKEKDFTREKFDTYIQGKQGFNAIKFSEFIHYESYQKAGLMWNFLKHNSEKSYNTLKGVYKECIYDPNNEFENGKLAINYIKLDEKKMLSLLDNISKFFDEVCERGFSENVKDAKWDYDDYFIKQVKHKINQLNNPLDI